MTSYHSVYVGKLKYEHENYIEETFGFYHMEVASH
jgi:hypothetical protein